jgi:TRAP-type mannitol/chloroaromatic compound transport system permease small subunit
LPEFFGGEMKKVALVFVNVIDRMNRFIGDYVGYLILPMIFVVCWEVIARKFFNHPTTWAMEMTWMIFAVYIIWSGGPSLLVKAQVRMDAVYNLWKPRVKASIDMVTFVCGLIFCLVLSMKAFEHAMVSWNVREMSKTPFGQPLYHLRMIVAFGTIFLLLQTLSDFVKNLWMVVTGEELKPEEGLNPEEELRP